jgi:hypothetical protein
MWKDEASWWVAVAAHFPEEKSFAKKWGKTGKKG